MLVPLTWKHKSDVTVYIGGVWCLASSLGVTCWRLELVTRQLPGVWPGWPQIRFGLLIDLHPASPFTPSCDCQTVNRQLSVGDILPGLRQCRHYLTSQWDIFIWQPPAWSRLTRWLYLLFIKRHHFSAHCLRTSKLERRRERQIERVTDSLNGKVDRHFAEINGLREIKVRRCLHHTRAWASKCPLYVYLANVSPEFINQSESSLDSHKIFHQLLKKYLP